MPPWNSTTPPMDISLISLVEVPFAYGKPLRQNMSWAKKLSKHEW